MVEENIKHGITYYVCEECGKIYRKYAEADTCERICITGKKCYMMKNSISF